MEVTHEARRERHLSALATRKAAELQQSREFEASKAARERLEEACKDVLTVPGYRSNGGNVDLAAWGAQFQELWDAAQAAGRADVYRRVLADVRRCHEPRDDEPSFYFIEAARSLEAAADRRKRSGLKRILGDQLASAELLGGFIEALCLIVWRIRGTSAQALASLPAGYSLWGDPHPEDWPQNSTPPSTVQPATLAAAPAVLGSGKIAKKPLLLMVFEFEANLLNERGCTRIIAKETARLWNVGHTKKIKPRSVQNARTKYGRL